MESKNTDLRESILFTARKASLPCSTEQSTSRLSDPASSSSRYYSARIHSMSKLDMNKEDAEIEASKDHWTEVESEYDTAATSVATDSSTSESEAVSGLEGTTEMDRQLYDENVEVIRSIQRQNPASDFFRYGGEWVLGRKIAEGGQAEIYESDQFIRPDGQAVKFDADGYTMLPNGPRFTYAKPGTQVLLKVFKAGYSLLEMQEQWPLALLQNFSFVDESVKSKFPDCCNPMFAGRLLGDGRFAFETFRRWGDVRKFVDLRMEHNGNQHPPLMMSDGNYFECCILFLMLYIAIGMRDLHKEGTLHRDLKASNVLMDSFLSTESSKQEDQFDPIQLDHSFMCFIADFECSIGVVGTGYWRAPEILEALKNRTVHTTPNIFTPKSDVYGYAMTCYKILTGLMPFEDNEDNGRTLVDDVLKGKRPTLPSHLRPWIKELLNKCWHMDPSERPTFKEIVDVITRIAEEDPGCQGESEFFKTHFKGIL